MCQLSSPSLTSTNPFDIMGDACCTRFQAAHPMFELWKEGKTPSWPCLILAACSNILYMLRSLCPIVVVISDKLYYYNNATQSSHLVPPPLLYVVCLLNAFIVGLNLQASVLALMGIRIVCNELCCAKWLIVLYSLYSE